MTIRKFFVVALLFSLAACSKDADSAREEPGAATAAASNEQAEEDLADLTKYDLSMNKMDEFFQTMRNMADEVKKMSPAERAAFDQDSESDNNASLDQMIAKAESNKVIRDASRKAGSSPREYVLTSLSYFTSAMAMSVLQMQPNANQDSLMREMKVNPDNIKFIKEHEAELTTKYKAMEAEMKALEPEES
jgi:hypothetical protein